MNYEIDISVVIPAYNERARLPAYLESIAVFCEGSKYRYEIIIVDDGSSDGTAAAVESYSSRFTDFRILVNEQNRGKGFSVRKGLLEASGEYCAYLDADGSVEIDEVDKNLDYLAKDGYDIFVGSRAIHDDAQVLITKWYRRLIGRVFNFLVQSILFKNIKDTQCGFKIFRKETVKPIFTRTYLNGFGFDIEVLYVASKMGYKVKEGPVSWEHFPGSKINIVSDSIRMFINILQIRNWHCVPINTESEYMGPNEYQFMYDLENIHWWFISRRNYLERILKTLNKHRPRILDVGTGTGGNLMVLERFGEATGIDISKKAVDFCHKRGLKNVQLSPGEALDFDDDSFDTICCLDVLEHVPEPVKTLREMKRVLKDDGVIIISVPAFRFLWSQHDEILCHFRRYEKESLKTDIEEAELKIVRLTFFFFLSFFAVTPIRIIRRLVVAGKQARSDTTTLPPRWLNSCLIYLLKVEIFFADKIGLPFGTSLFAIVRK